MINWSTYTRTYVQAVDMCAAGILAHRLKQLPLKAIYLWPDMYKQFKGYVEKNLGRELTPGEKLEFDGVYIEEGTRSQSTPLLMELWAGKKPASDFQKYLERKN